LVLLTWQSPAENGFVDLARSLAGGRTLPPPPINEPGPFALSDPDHVVTTLESSGFRDVHLDAVAGSMWFGASPESAYEFVLGLLGWMLEDLGAEQRRTATASLQQTLSSHATEDGVRLKTGAWIITAHRS
jgi:hypothetical protein